MDGRLLEYNYSLVIVEKLSYEESKTSWCGKSIKSLGI